METPEVPYNPPKPKRNQASQPGPEKTEDNRNIRLQIADDPSLSTHAATIEENFNDGVEKISAKLPIHDVTVRIIPQDMPDIPVPILGYAPNAREVNLYLDGNNPNIKAAFGKAFQQSFAHEMNHAMRWEGPGFGSTLFDVMIAEGLAQHFEQEVVEDSDPILYTRGLTSDQIAELTEKAKKEFEHPLTGLDEYHDKWFWSGSEAERIPPTAGYAVGYVLVGNYLKSNPDKKASDLVLEPPETFRPTA